MPKTLAKLFRDQAELDTIMETLKSQGYKKDSLVTIKGQVDIAAALADCEPSEAALDYYKMGLTLGGTVLMVTADDAKVDALNVTLRAVGTREMTDIPLPWSTSPGFANCEKQSCTHPIDASMSGDFRKY